MIVGRDHLERTLRDALVERDADCFVHAGRGSEPAIRYCLAEPADSAGEYVAVAFDGADWRVRSRPPAHRDSAHPIESLLESFGEGRAGTALTPRTIPHDAALYLENAGLSPSSTEATARARATKTEGEIERLEAAQTAAAAGIRRAAAALASAERTADGSLAAGGDPLTAARLRRELDAGIVAADGIPTGRTRIETADGATGDAEGVGIDSDPAADEEAPLRTGVPIVLETTTREPGGYRGHLARTVVVDGKGGPERRAHVALTNALRSARSLLTADAASVAAVEADIEAEIRAFGFEEGISASVCGIGLEPVERPLGGDAVGAGSAIRLEAAVDGPGYRVLLADAFVCGPPVGSSADERAEATRERPSRLDALSRSLEPEEMVG